MKKLGKEFKKRVLILTVTSGCCLELVLFLENLSFKHRCCSCVDVFTFLMNLVYWIPYR